MSKTADIPKQGAVIAACRFCLNTDTKLISTNEKKLKETLKILMECWKLRFDKLPPFVCVYCKALIYKLLAFRHKCLRIQKLLDCKKMLIDKDFVKEIQQLNTLVKSNTEIFDINAELKREEEDVTLTMDGNDFDDGDDEDRKNIELVDLKTNSVSKGDKIYFEDDNVKIPVIDDKSDLDNILKSKTRSKLKTQKKLTKRNNVPNKIKTDEKAILTRNRISPNDSVEFVAEFEKAYNVEIVKLSKEDQLKEMLQRKKSKNYLTALYSCDQCYKGFMAEATFRNHMSVHELSRGSLVCELCKFRYSRYCELRAHQKRHAIKFVCRQCQHVSISGDQAKQHCKWHSGQKYVCKYCDASFDKKTSHLSHVRIHHQTELNKCQVCGAGFVGEYGLMVHMKKAHRQMAVDTPDMKCDTCGLQFYSLAALKTHGKGCCGTGKPCLHCGECFNTETDLSVHLREEHFKKEKQVYKCNQCDASYLDGKSYTNHVETVHLKTKVKQRKKHRCEKTRSENCVCETCGKTYSTKAHLRYHQRSHTGEKPHQCTECPKAFTQAQLLQLYHKLRELQSKRRNKKHSQKDEDHSGKLKY